ncbi:MAG TPA: flagellar hook-associated protein FlgL [Gaiellaceae bacterium]|jgi:flagellar hook-associated protein 3 FlgL|nr:flagellar hook-associated protein FlgL [Gaiellaceae bacterium]
MTRITNSMVSRTVLADIQNVQAQLTSTQERLSSGKEITKPSDDPFGTSRALLFTSEISANTQYQSNVQDASSWLTTTDAALSSMSSDAGRARDLILEGANGSFDQNDRDAIADELDQLADSIKTAGNSQYAGNYVFGGTVTQTPPFAMGAVDTYAGNSAAINRSIGQGVTMQVNITGDQVVSPILAAIRQAAIDLRSGGTPGNLGTTDLAALDAATAQLSSAQATVGARENRLTTAASRLQQLEQAQSQQLSDTQDADMAQTMIDFSTQSAVYQAALKAGATLIQPSLMDFLSS